MVSAAMTYPLSKILTVCTGLDHPEGIAVGRDGSLYTGGEAGQVYRVSSDGGRTEILADTGGRCLGITLDATGNVYVCDPGRRQLLKVTDRGEVVVVAEAVGGRKLVCPNFSVFDSAGYLYFSDSGKWKQCDGFIGRVAPGGAVELFAEGPFHFANGLALDAAEDFLYVVESNRDRVIRIPIRADKSAGLWEVYAENLARIPDGLAFDCDGNLYVTTYASNAIYRVSTRGETERVCIDDECALLCQATNCAFGGSELDQLFVANLGAGHLSRLDLKVKGQPLLHQRANGELRRQ
jgi:gluconolactonase